MAGLVKGKDYDWKDSNLALFGSDTEKQVCVWFSFSHLQLIPAFMNTLCY